MSNSPNRGPEKELDLRTRLRRIIEVLPAGAFVQLPVDAVREWLAEDRGSAGDSDSERLPDAGLTVAGIAEHMDRDPSTVRGWISEGRFPNAWKLGREWRIPHTDLAQFLNGGAADSLAPASRPEPGLSGNGDLSAWRRERAE